MACSSNPQGVANSSKTKVPLPQWLGSEDSYQLNHVMANMFSLLKKTFDLILNSHGR